MKNISIDKLTVNIGCGEAGDKLDKAKKLLESLTSKKIVITRTHKRTTFGVAKARPIGCKVTLRGKDAEDFLKKALDSVEFKIKKRSFDKQGNVSFGVKEHIHLPGVRYDPSIGIYGMDVCVTLKRPGYRVSRKANPGKIGANHAIKSEEAMSFMAEKFSVKVV